MYTLLYVDDEFALLDITKIYLERSGELSVDTATSAIEAIGMLLNRRYDAIISDYQMPEMDGIEFLKRIRTSGSTIPFIIFTGKGREEVVIQALNEGADFYLQKGGDPKAQFAELANIITQAVRRKKGEEALRESEERYRNVVESQTEFISRFKPNGIHVFVNEAYCRYFGLKRDEILGHRFQPNIPAEDQERVKWFFKSLTPDHPIDTIEHRIIMPDGVTRWQRWSDRAIFDPSGTVTEYQSVGLDITDKKQAEDELMVTNERLFASEEKLRSQFNELAESDEKIRESEEFLKRVITGAREGIIVYDRELRITLWNRFMEEMTGLKESDVQGKNALELFPFHKEVGNDLLMMRALAGSTAESFDFEFFIRSTGKKGWVKGIYSPNYDFHGRIIGVIGIVRNITARKELEFSLKLSEERYRNVVEDQTEFICRFLPDGTHVFVNEAYCRYFNKKREEIIGKRFVPQIPAEDRNAVREHFASLTKDHSVAEIRHRIIMPDGQIRWQRWSDRAIFDAAGNIIEYQSVGRDITDIIKGEEALRESEERYRNVVEDQTEFICRFLPDGTHIFVNEAYCRYFGLKRDEILGHRFRPKILPEDQKRVRQFFESLTPDRSVDNIEHRIIMPDGMVKWQQWSDRAIFDPSGTITEYQSVGRDITDRKQAEEALHETNEYLHNLLDYANAPIIVWDPEFRITRFNHAFEDLTGMTEQEVIGQHLSILFPAPSRETSLEQIKKTLAGERWDVVEIPILNVSGEIRIVLWNSANIVDPDGTIISTIAQGQDITGRKQAETNLQRKNEELNAAYEQLAAVEEELRTSFHELADSQKVLEENKATLDSIIDESPIPQFVIDRNHRITHWNKALAEYSGIMAESVVDTTEQWRAFYDTERPCLADLLLDGKVDKISAWYEGKFKKSILIDDAYEAIDFFPRMTGEGKWLYFTAGLVRDRDGKVIGAVETLEDITNEKHAQDASALANKKLHLLSSITRHDILNQLTVLKGYLELSRRAVHDPAKLSDFIKKEIKAAETIEEQIGFTRDYQNIGVNAPIWQNVNASISRAVASLPMRNVRLDLDCTDHEVLADQLLEKVFYNLIDNAIRHGGKKLSTIRFLSHESDRGMIIVCEDDGVGISRKEKEHLFERGFGKHTGLGLNLVREILSITGITISEIGEYGKGVRFEILVPKGKYRIANVQ
jgi:PAS domain S-box-containing protein